MSMPRRLRLAISTALLALPLALPVALHAAPPKDEVVRVRTVDPVMLAARAKARAGLDRFFARLAAPGAEDNGFSLKFDLNHGHPERGEGEIIWAKQVTAEGGRIYGVLDNHPLTQGFTIGERVEIPYDAITDWAIRRGDKFEGHYSTRALFPKMNKQDLAMVQSRLWPE